MADKVYVRGDVGTLAYHDGTAYKPVVCLTSSSHAMTMNMIEKVNMCTEGQTIQTPQSISESVQIEGEVLDTTVVGGDPADVTVGELKELAREQLTTRVPTPFRLNRGPEGFLYFNGYLTDISDNYTAGEDATFSATLTIVGTPTGTDPNA